LKDARSVKETSFERHRAVTYLRVQSEDSPRTL
jgi:hypothetical protein